MPCIVVMYSFLDIIANPDIISARTGLSYVYEPIHCISLAFYGPSTSSGSFNSPPTQNTYKNSLWSNMGLIYHERAKRVEWWSWRVPPPRPLVYLVSLSYRYSRFRGSWAYGSKTTKTVHTKSKVFMNTMDRSVHATR